MNSANLFVVIIPAANSLIATAFFHSNCQFNLAIIRQAANNMFWINYFHIMRQF